MRYLVLLAAVVAVLVADLGGAVASLADEPLRVLVYSRTAGFRHVSIPDGIAAIQSLGDAHGFEVEATEDPAAFTPDNLARFDVVVFLNTTGTVVEDDGKAAFEQYLRGGGGYVGVHAAADTEYDWDFYGQVLAGAYFLAHPIQQPGVIVNEAPDEPSTAHLPERWTILFEEFYSFQRSPRDDVRVLLSIDESTYLQDPNTTHIPRGLALPDGQTGVMGDHPMAWCHHIDAGTVWYTALGHEGYLYRLPEYRQHLLGGLLTAAGQVDADCGPGPTPAAPPTATPSPTRSPDEGNAPTDRSPTPAPSSAPPAPTPAPVAAPPLPATGTGAAGFALALVVLGGALRRRAG